MKKSKKSSTGPKIDPYLEGLMAKLLEHLVSLEKKVDALIGQGVGRPQASNNNQNQPKPQQNQQISQPKPAPRRDKVLYEAICADCHKVCEVPFKPSENRPVYCKPCFAKRKAGNGPDKFHIPLTPVALASKPAAPQAAPEISKKTKKAAPIKKAKKKK